MDPHASHREIGRKRQLYREELARHGFSEEGRTIPVARLLAIAATDAEAERVAYEGARWTVGSYANPKNAPRNRGVDHAPGEDPVERYVRDVIVHGSPERVVDELMRLREDARIEYLLCSPLSHESFVLFTERVMPRLLSG
jgi:alkanesulfonate monooxygenase SsuD/methylene tetrahydromethanopterin reductase-like flavin-dependent oxidoreductase (luciferase family)